MRLELASHAFTRQIIKRVQDRYELSHSGPSQAVQFRPYRNDHIFDWRHDGAMCYMMSKQQYLNDDGKSWHPHLMFFVPGDAAKSWGANLPGSPVMAADDPQERVTIFFVLVGSWSDGTPAPPIVH